MSTSKVTESTPSVTPAKGDGGARTLALTTSFILAQLDGHKKAHAGKDVVPPLFVGVQGPQGCGKSYLTGLLPPALGAAPHNLRLASLSLDDLYLPHAEQNELAAKYPTNRMLGGRGQPGTHDLPLGSKCLAALKAINEPGAGAVELPVYEKSLFGGRGDRTKEVVKVEGPVDVVIFEGWMNGFFSLPDEELVKRYEAASSDPTSYAKSKLDYETPFFTEHSLEDLQVVNGFLKAYETDLWSYVDAFVQLKPVEMNYVWFWRLEQEHNMKAKNGGVGMTDDEVKAFIARYMPGYELFLEGIQSTSAKWEGKGLKLIVSRVRTIDAEEPF